MKRSLPAMFSIAPLVAVPAAWHLDRERSATMATANQEVRHFGTAPSVDVIEAYYPVEIGTGLIVSRYTTTTLPDGRSAAIAAVIGTFEAWGQPDASAITERTGARAVGDKQLELTVGGRELGATMRYRSRMIVAADATSVVAVVGQCVERDDANPAHVAQCHQALLTLDPGIAATDRVGIAFPTTPTTPTTSIEAPTGTGRQLGGPATLGDGTKLKFPPITVPLPAPEPDRRPLFVGVGVVVLAAALWWNRRSRDRFEDDKEIDA
ncbi:MAG: hypothetical protein NT062_22475 [Proteobacteria bacterium]|nr:hypothetical protein [Pseudomonadota bacterium]